ncbi:MAG: ATP-binding protein [Desulfobacterales bacterium]|nr:ATP-binding protein [Desulfobacterales bacterium]
MADIKLSLKSRIFLANAALLCITLVGAGLMVWNTFRVQDLFKSIIKTDVTISQASQALATALANQKGLVSYYLLDRDPKWLNQLARQRHLFNRNLTRVESRITDPWEYQAIQQIKEAYGHYTTTRDRVIQLYKAGKVEQSTQILSQARTHFFNILNLCDQFKALHWDKINGALTTSQRQANQLRYMALAAVVTVLLLSLMVNFIFSRHILGPIRRLTSRVELDHERERDPNEVMDLKRSVMGLVKNAELTHEKLKQSQAVLMQSEKLAMVGRLAAGTAHSIRNPLTSVKMRLFSLGRRARFSPSQKEDFQVISSEIQQINRIVDNFLEFARPPRLVTRVMSPSQVVDSTLHLLAQRLKSFHVTPELIREMPLPDTRIDPEQLKEVLVNIIINACEAMGRGGQLTIKEQVRQGEDSDRAAVIQILDNGPGIPEDIQDQIFEPFFTTKENGTGLGLNIAFNIINQHQGRLDISSEPGRGCCFTLTLPSPEAFHG